MPNLEESNQFMFYSSEDGATNIQVTVENETVWVTQAGMVEIFDVSKSSISEHLSNIFADGELIEDSVVRKNRTTAADGKNYNMAFYNLDAIISVGYRVNSYKATQFRIWATKVLKEYLVKGFAMDDERLKQGKTLFGKDYFDELLDRIRDIRSSERRFYQKVTDIYALSSDYDNKAPITHDFFATVQNKLHWAITGHTSAELIYEKSDASKPHMGLQTWKNAPNGKVLKGDIKVAKNYLEEEHINELNRLVSAYLDLAENRAERQIIMKMTDWVTFLNNFLELSNYPILTDRGKISAERAKIKASQEYEIFRVKQDVEYISDFDKAVKQIKSTGNLPKVKQKQLEKKITNFDKKLKRALEFNPKD